MPSDETPSHGEWRYTVRHAGRDDPQRAAFVNEVWARLESAKQCPGCGEEDAGEFASVEELKAVAAEFAVGLGLMAGVTTK